MVRASIARVHLLGIHWLEVHCLEFTGTTTQQQPNAVLELEILSGTVFLGLEDIAFNEEEMQSERFDAGSASFFSWWLFHR
jgi:hypothetical protein